MNNAIKRGFEIWRTLILYGLLGILSLIVFSPMGLGPFLYGYHVGNLITFVFTFGLAGLIFLILYLTLSVWFVSSLLRGGFKGSRKLFYISLTGTILPLTLMVAHFLCIPGNKFHEGFYQRVREYISIVELRQWAQDLDDETFQKWSDFQIEKTDPIHAPQAVYAFKPKGGLRIFVEQGVRCIRLDWGGGFDHWGLVIGPADMKIPPSDSEFGISRYKVDEGVYAWQDK